MRGTSVGGTYRTHGNTLPALTETPLPALYEEAAAQNPDFSKDIDKDVSW